MKDVINEKKRTTNKYLSWKLASEGSLEEMKYRCSLLFHTGRLVRPVICANIMRVNEIYECLID
jgi:hypothetical protein